LTPPLVEHARTGERRELTRRQLGSAALYYLDLRIGQAGGVHDAPDDALTQELLCAGHQGDGHEIDGGHVSIVA
jgi:hypothetical protein